MLCPSRTNVADLAIRRRHELRTRQNFRKLRNASRVDSLNVRDGESYDIAFRADNRGSGWTTATSSSTRPKGWSRI